MADAAMVRVFQDLVERMREPLGLDRWLIRVAVGPCEETAACAAMPEYRTATITVDPDRLQTGDEPDELVAHELAHCHTWAAVDVADDLAILVAELMNSEPLGKFLKEQVRRAEEDTTTTVGQTYVRLLRRWWKAEADLKAAHAELRTLKKERAA